MECSQKQGEEAGRYLRVLLLWMGTADAAMQLNKLGVDCYCLDAQGQKQLRRLQEVILEAAQKQAADKEGEKLLPDIAAGCFDAANLGALFGGYDSCIENCRRHLARRVFRQCSIKNLQLR